MLKPYCKIRSLVFALFSTVIISNVVTADCAQSEEGNNDTQADSAAESKTAPQIPAKVIAKWQKLAEEGNADAQFLLGKAYYDGNGVAQDYAQALELWHKAAAQGNAAAQRALDQLVPK